MKILNSIYFLILILNIGLSQESWEQFRNEKREYYWTLENSAVENFSCLVSSSDYIFFMSDKADSTYYFPLKVIWLKDGRTFTILQPLPPGMSDSMQVQLINKVEQLKKIFKGTLSDWQQFALFTPFSDVPEIPTVSFGKDTIGVSYSLSEDNQQIMLKKTFTRGGALARVRWITSDLQITTYPSYREIENKWVCRGWKSQFYKRGTITSGFAVVLELKRANNIWLPNRFEITAQSQNTGAQKSVMQLYLKDYILNQKIEVISETSDTSRDSGTEATPR